MDQFEDLPGLPDLPRLSELPLYNPQERKVPAPEYYAKDGKTPIYKIFRKNPYGRR